MSGSIWDAKLSAMNLIGRFSRFPAIEVIFWISKDFKEFKTTLCLCQRHVVSFHVFPSRLAIGMAPVPGRKREMVVSANLFDLVCLVFKCRPGRCK